MNAEMKVRKVALLEASAAREDEQARWRLKRASQCEERAAALGFWRRSERRHLADQAAKERGFAKTHAQRHAEIEYEIESVLAEAAELPAVVDPPRLSIELVPETCWGSSLASQLPRTQWDVLRRGTYAAAGNCCEICGESRPRGNRGPVDCHEIWSYDDETNVQRLEGLIALCGRCHEVKHFGRARVRGNEARAWAHLLRINEWDEATARVHFHEQGQQWVEHSHHNWSVDLSILREKYGQEPPPEPAGRRVIAWSPARSR